MVDNTNSAQKTTVSSDQTNYSPASGSMVKEAEPAIISAPEAKAQPEIPPSLEAELEKAKESVSAQPPANQQGVIKTSRDEILPQQESSEIEESRRRLQQIESTKKTSSTSDSVYWLHKLLKKFFEQLGLKDK
ncbi:MAG: hypothetical protein Q7R31_02130 [Candidatus Levybacteria bacterium]|nr:hypothetical protein [Candidatus Levybacteria bacterium]